MFALLCASCGARLLAGVILSLVFINFDVSMTPAKRLATDKLLRSKFLVIVALLLGAESFS